MKGGIPLTNPIRYVVEFDPVLALTPENDGKFLARIHVFEAGEHQPSIPKRYHKISLVGDSLPEAVMQVITWLAAGAPDRDEAERRIAKTLADWDAEHPDAVPTIPENPLL